jgi:enolase
MLWRRFRSTENPTVEVEVTLMDGSAGSILPSYWCLNPGMQAIRAATEERCTQAVENVNDEIADHLLGLDATEQKDIDRAMIDLDGTPNKSRLAPTRF